MDSDPSIHIDQRMIKYVYIWVYISTIQYLYMHIFTWHMCKYTMYKWPSVVKHICLCVCKNVHMHPWVRGCFLMASQEPTTLRHCASSSMPTVVPRLKIGWRRRSTMMSSPRWLVVGAWLVASPTAPIDQLEVSAVLYADRLLHSLAVTSDIMCYQHVH